MSKKLTIPYEGKEYTLEFTRRTVSEMEKKGFIATEIKDKPMTRLPELFAGAFLANHRFVKPELIEKIYDGLTKKEELIGKLCEMYNEPITALISDPEDSKGNVSWTATW